MARTCSAGRMMASGNGASTAGSAGELRPAVGSDCSGAARLAWRTRRGSPEGPGGAGDRSVPGTTPSTAVRATGIDGLQAGEAGAGRAGVDVGAFTGAVGAGSSGRAFDA